MMIATCGHEVKQGIMATLSLDSETLSYGSYCDKCIKAIHEHDQSVEDGELKNLLDELQTLKAELEREKACVDFYQNDYNHFKNIDMDVDGYGKLARETQKARAM